MAQKKAFEVDGWLARPDGRSAIVLFYGTDRGLVSERAKMFAAKSGLPLDDPFSVVRIDAGSEAEAGRLVDEAQTVPMFSARRLLWVRNAGSQKAVADDVAALTQHPPADAIVLIEAGELKKGAPLRKLVEESPHAMALPCYGDEEKGVDALIADEMRRSGLTITPEAQAALRPLLGGDRLASRGELEKLALYALGKGEITSEDVRSVAGDASAFSVDDLIDLMLAGDGAGFSGLFSRHMQSPSQVQQMLASALRQFQALHLMRARMESARHSASIVVAAHRPPLFGPRRTLIEKALGRWDAAFLQNSLSRLHGAVLETRRRPDLAFAVAERAVMNILADRGGRSPA